VSFPNFNPTSECAAVQLAECCSGPIVFLQLVEEGKEGMSQASFVSSLGIFSFNATSRNSQSRPNHALASCIGSMWGANPQHSVRPHWLCLAPLDKTKWSLVGPPRGPSSGFTFTKRCVMRCLRCSSPRRPVTACDRKEQANMMRLSGDSLDIGPKSIGSRTARTKAKEKGRTKKRS